jgi:hypothetical protein
MVADLPAEQIRDAVEAVARETLAEAGVDGPPVDALTVARRLGLIVARDDHAPDVRARFVRLGGGSVEGQPTILVADDPRPERRQWAIAHEVGEHRSHRVFAKLGLDARDADPAAREAVANRLAGCLLLPREWLLSDGGSVDWDLFELKACYATVSHEMIARRMLEMPPAVIITLWDQGRQVWRRGNMAGRTPPLTAAEGAARRAAHDLGRRAQCDPAELPEGVEDVRAWPIHEPDWKREIIRTQITELD